MIIEYFFSTLIFIDYVHTCSSSILIWTDSAEMAESSKLAEASNLAEAVGKALAESASASKLAEAEGTLLAEIFEVSNLAVGASTSKFAELTDGDDESNLAEAVGIALAEIAGAFNEMSALPDDWKSKCNYVKIDV